MKTNPRPGLSGKILLLSALAALPLSAAVLPVDLPAPDPTDKGSKDNPVKVYIQSGQSNSFGMGRVEGAQPFYSQIFLSADPTVTDSMLPGDKTAIMRFGVFQSAKPDAPTGGTAKVFKGPYDAKADSTILKPAAEQSVALGTVNAKLPSIDGPHTIVVNAFLEVPLDGTYQLHAGTGSSARAIATVNGTEVYRKDSEAAAVLTDTHLKKGQRHPLQITFLDGGTAALWLEMTNLKGMGDLRFVVNKLGRFPYLIDKEGDWTARQDVMLNDAYMGKGKSDPLGAKACGPSFGPELGFGYVMGAFHDEPVIVIKADIGNRSLGWDVLPPGSESYTFDGKNYPGYKEMLDVSGKVIPWDGKGWYAGKQYDDYTTSIRDVLDNFSEKYPQYAKQGFEVAGFIWWQGHKDSGNPAHMARYEQNLVNLIKAWRKEFNAPNAKWAIATLGFHGANMPDKYKPVTEAQLAVADPARHPELAGTVKTIDTRPFWRDPAVSPMNQDYHYNHNAETYMLVGDALGRAMVELYGGKVVYPDSAMPQKVAPLPQLAAPTPEALDAMRVALRPIVLDKIIPEYVATAPGLPGYRSGGLSLTYFAENTPPAKPSASLGSQLDKVIAYYQLVGIDDYHWQPAGPDMQLAHWEYLSFDPPEKKTDATGDRYRPITLPAGMENWASPDFNAAKAGWKTGQAPFGQNNGKQLALREKCGNPHCHCDVTPNTLWEKEVLLIRGNFKMPTFGKGKRYRLIVGGGSHTWAGEGFALYINGQQVAEMTGGYYKNGGDPRGTYLFEDLLPKIENQDVTIAVKAFLRQNSHRNKAAPPSGHLSVWLEEATLPPAVGTITNQP